MSKVAALLIFLLSSPAFAGGWTSSGGGSGILCFDDEAAAALIRRGDHLSQHPELYSRLTSFLVTDIWENTANSFIAPLEGEKPKAYLTRVLDTKLAMTAPGFYANLKAALERVEITRTVLSKKKLPQTNDTGVIARWQAETRIGPRNLSSDYIAPNSKCAVVQVAFRKVTGRGSQMRVHLQVDSELYGLLGLQNPTDRILNQAAIQLHEALYLLGAQGGHQTSIQARRMTAVLLSNDKFAAFSEAEREFAKQHPGSINSMAGYVQRELTQNDFGHVTIRGGERDPRLAAAAQRQAAKRNQLMQSQIPNDTAGNEQKISAYFDSLTDEEAFFELAEAAIRHGYFTDISTLIDPRAPDYAANRRIMCRGTRPEAVIFDASRPVSTAPAILRATERVQRFCRKLKIQ